MTAKPKPRETITPKKTQIEQAIAFGRSLDWIVDHLHVEPADVDERLRYLDKVIRERDVPPPVRYSSDLEAERAAVTLTAQLHRLDHGASLLSHTRAMRKNRGGPGGAGNTGDRALTSPLALAHKEAQ